MKYKRNVELFKLILDDEFCLKSEPKIVIKKSLELDGEHCFGLYYGDKIKKHFRHKIKISKSENQSVITLFNTMAHEYIHCWQMEKGLELLHCEQQEFKMWHEYFFDKYNIDVIGLE